MREIDLISRQAAIEAIKTWGLIDGLSEGQAIEILADEEKLPSAQPDPHYDEWCTDCKEYDHDKHCCPRWNRVIRQTLKDAQPDSSFITWLLDEIWDEEMWELNSGAFPEIVCRKLVKLGFVRERNGEYERLDQ